MTTELHRILFLDRTNSARSQLAEALCRRMAGDAIAASSAGLDPRPIPEATYLVLREVGVDTGGLHAKSVTTFLAKVAVRWAVILRDPTEPDGPRIYPFAAETLHWPCPDPERTIGSFAEQLAAFRWTRDHLEARIASWLTTHGSRLPRPSRESASLAPLSGAA